MLAKLIARLMVFAVYARWSSKQALFWLAKWLIVLLIALAILYFIVIPNLPVVVYTLIEARANIGQINTISKVLIYLVLGLFTIIISGYLFKWRWTGLPSYTYTKEEKKEVYLGKTLWDWMQLLIIPAVLAAAALLFNFQNQQTQQNIATDNQRETTLQAYFDKMSELMLDGNLLTSKLGGEERNVARTRTLSTLRILDGRRKGQVIQFLQESRLISKTTTLVSLTGADLSGADLTGASLTGADLSGTNLTCASLQLTLTCVSLNLAKLNGANLSRASLTGASLQYTQLISASLTRADLTCARFTDVDLPDAPVTCVSLYYANLSDANLSDADLSDADLTGADLSDADLRGAKFADANLGSANLTGADLRGASLFFAHLDNADLSGAKLNAAYLAGAKLDRANLTGADLSGARWLSTTCPDGTNSDNNGNTCVNHLSNRP